MCHMLRAIVTTVAVAVCGVCCLCRCCLLSLFLKCECGSVKVKVKMKAARRGARGAWKKRKHQTSEGKKETELTKGASLTENTLAHCEVQSYIHFAYIYVLLLIFAHCELLLIRICTFKIKNMMKAKCAQPQHQHKERDNPMKFYVCEARCLGLSCCSSGHDVAYRLMLLF